MLQRRRLNRAEFDLGWLGWQQAEFFGTEVQAQIEKIQQFEKEQARLLNLSADHAAALRRLEERRQAARDNFESDAAEKRTQREQVEKHLAETELKLDENKAAAKRFSEALRELEKLPDVLTDRYNALMAVAQVTDEIREERLRVHDLRANIPSERQDLAKRELAVTREISQLESGLSAARAQRSMLLEAEQKALETFENEDREFAKRVAASQRQIKVSERRSKTLDAKKREPFLLVGRCLADHEIAPMNQPATLERVHECRAKVAAIAEKIAASRAESAEVPATSLVYFYVLLILALAAIIFLAMHARGGRFPQ